MNVRRSSREGGGPTPGPQESSATAAPSSHAGRAKAPPVWLDLDQAALDAAYDQRVWAPNLEQVVARYAQRSEGVRQSLGAPLRCAYGSALIETLDIHRTDRPHAPVHVFIHGGAWRAGAAQDYAFPAALFVPAGVHWVAPDFACVQDVSGSLLPLADQVRRAVAWVYRNAARFGGDANRLYLSGHSSGAHLAAVAHTTDWPGEFGLPADTLKGGVLCSGMYDLKPVRLSARSAYVAFTDEVEQALSPQRHLARLAAPLVVACGTQESPEFQRQAREFAAAALAAGKPIRLLEGEGYNHFEILETLADPAGLLGRAALEQMGL